ncbi:MAG: DUF1850 domain-containing protein [Betaproteobacteria bacterium HGW-Betaproteobacteria-21]|nr:MAG: DUF1850 domain-containing protein [Betaproteobacteria bacterium HGW-Betaproteobacteria-21]
MAICLSTAAATVAVAVHAFTLGWTHSIEKVRWEEDWRVADGQLVLEAVRVRGHGAGMEPAQGAILRDGTWEWHPRTVHAELRLTRSEHTADYDWCAPDRACVPMSSILPSDGGVSRVAPCADAPSLQR